jgi:putative membrane protein
MAESDTKLRDAMAVERTHLANERTLLSYVRTALGLVAGGFGLTHLVTDQTGIQIGRTLMACGGAILLLGLWRFVSIRRRIRGEGGIPPKV